MLSTRPASTTQLPGCPAAVARKCAVQGLSRVLLCWIALLPGWVPVCCPQHLPVSPSSTLDHVFVPVVLLWVKYLPPAGGKDVLVALIPMPLNNLSAPQVTCQQGAAAAAAQGMVLAAKQSTTAFVTVEQSTQLAHHVTSLALICKQLLAGSAAK